MSAVEVVPARLVEAVLRECLADQDASLTDLVVTPTAGGPVLRGASGLLPRALHRGRRGADRPGDLAAILPARRVRNRAHPGAVLRRMVRNRVTPVLAVLERQMARLSTVKPYLT